MYSPSIGRFLSVDPLHELMPSHNPYHYAFNSPLVWKDPSGLAPEKDKNIHSEKLQGQFIKLRDLSTPIMPGDEFWVYVKDDRDRFIDFYFSAEYDAGLYQAALWQQNFSMLAMLGMGGSSSSGGGSEGGGPRTYDPYHINESSSNDGKDFKNNSSNIYWPGVIGNGSAFKVPNLASAKPLKSREQRKIRQLMSSSSLLNTIINQYQIIAKNKNKTLVFYSIVDNICWAQINKNNINQYNIYLSKDLFKGNIPFWKSLYLVAHEFKHYFDWLDGKLSNDVFGIQVDKNGNSYELLVDELRALQFGNSILSDYYESKKITNGIYMGEYIFYLPDGTEFPFPIMKSMMFNPIKGKY